MLLIVLVFILSIHQINATCKSDSACQRSGSKGFCSYRSGFPGICVYRSGTPYRISYENVAETNDINPEPEYEKMAEAGESNSAQEVMDVLAIATFKSTESGIDGIVEVDSNGNIIIDLEIPNSDTLNCQELEYTIYSKNDYDDNKSRKNCDLNKLGNIFNPFGTYMCDSNKQYDNMYFECAIGDLSGRCGTIKLTDNNQNVNIECNVAENDSKRMLTPESLYERSVALSCKDKANGKGKVLACAGFEITIN